MIPYREFRPTGFDCRGLNADNIGPDDSPGVSDWLVAPYGHNRDSELLTESNWDAQLSMLREIDPDGNDHFDARFGHWANGWFEIVLVRPGSPCETKAQEIGDALESYPVLDEEDWSNREWEEMDRIWREMSVSERYNMIADIRKKCEHWGDRNLAPSIFAARRDYFPKNDRLEEELREWANG